jgi:hypothetical protein
MKINFQNIDNLLINKNEHKSLSEFYPYYLSQHRNNMNRLLHLIGTSLSLVNIFFAFFTLSIILIPLSFVIGYSLAWLGHFFFEKNKPATFKYPVMSFICDFIMAKDILTLNIHKKFLEYNIVSIKYIPVEFI